MSAITPVRERAAAARAIAFVWMAATLERIVRDALSAAFKEISASSTAARDLRVSLFALICDGDFSSVANRSKGSSWQVKVDMFARALEESPAVLSEHVLPLDGKTIRGEHFDAIWLVLGLPRASVPTPMHRAALKDLADGRNEVAHGHEDPVLFGRRRPAGDVLKLVSRVEDVIMHFLAALDEYLENSAYRR